MSKDNTTSRPLAQMFRDLDVKRQGYIKTQDLEIFLSFVCFDRSDLDIERLCKAADTHNLDGDQQSDGLLVR